VDSKNRKVACRLHRDDDLKKEMKSGCWPE